MSTLFHKFIKVAVTLFILENSAVWADSTGHTPFTATASNKIAVTVTHYNYNAPWGANMVCPTGSTQVSGTAYLADGNNIYSGFTLFFKCTEYFWSTDHFYQLLLAAAPNTNPWVPCNQNPVNPSAPTNEQCSLNYSRPPLIRFVAPLPSAAPCVNCTSGGIPIRFDDSRPIINNVGVGYSAQGAADITYKFDSNMQPAAMDNNWYVTLNFRLFGLAEDSSQHWYYVPNPAGGYPNGVPYHITYDMLGKTCTILSNGGWRYEGDQAKCYGAGHDCFVGGDINNGIALICK